MDQLVDYLRETFTDDLVMWDVEYTQRAGVEKDLRGRCKVFIHYRPGDPGPQPKDITITEATPEFVLARLRLNLEFQARCAEVGIPAAL